MDIAILGFDRRLDAIVANVERSSREGFTGYWVPNGRGSDALTALAIAGADIDIRIGTAVVPIHTRHPVALAQQALTVNAVLGGRLTLGLGVSHRAVVEDGWGLSFDRPLSYLREYLAVLRPLIEEGSVAITGERISVNADLDIDAPPCRVLVAALGPRMLDLAGREADGTVTWMVGLETLRTLTVPTIRAAAEEAGRDDPQVVVGIPVCVTDDAQGARRRADESLARYGELPSYRSMLDREGLQHPGDLCIIGTPNDVARRIGDFFAAGATSVAAAPMGTAAEQDDTRSCLAALVE